MYVSQRVNEIAIIPLFKVYFWWRIGNPDVNFNIMFGDYVSKNIIFGEMAEWTIAPVLKTGGPKGPGGSNPSLSAEYLNVLNKSYCRSQREIVRRR